MCTIQSENPDPTAEYLEHLNARAVELARVVKRRDGCVDGFGQDVRLHYEANMRAGNGV